MQISLIYLILAFNCIIFDICVTELSKSINQSINQSILLTYVVIFSFTYRLLIISQFTNCMIEPFYINVFHSFSRCCFHYISCCQIFQLFLSLLLFSSKRWRFSVLRRFMWMEKFFPKCFTLETSSGSGYGRHYQAS